LTASLHAVADHGDRLVLEDLTHTLDRIVRALDHGFAGTPDLDLSHRTGNSAGRTTSDLEVAAQRRGQLRPPLGAGQAAVRTGVGCARFQFWVRDRSWMQPRHPEGSLPKLKPRPGRPLL